MTDQIQSPLPLIGFAAFSGTGKTTLLTQLIPALNSRGLRVGMIKHAHHRFDVDHPGKDSYQLRKAGADQMLIGSGRRWALMTETPEQSGDPDLQYLIDRLDHDRLDLIMVEGFKRLPFPKIELHRPATGQPLLFPDDPNIIAIAHDGQLPVTPQIPRLDLNNVEAIADYVVDFCQLATIAPQRTAL